jgi:Rnl2 family RNA ligase
MLKTNNKRRCIMFQKYNKIENSYRLGTEITENKNDLFAVSEKIHGANFGMYYNKDGFYCASRNNKLAEDANFNNFRYALEKSDIKSKMKEIYKMLGNRDFIMYGEIFGGNYPHPDVPKGKFKMVQKGVYYSPDINILAFDICVEGKYLSYAEFKNICEEVDFPYIKARFVGKLTDCLNYSNEFQSTISDYYGLPPIDDNICEGVVIRGYAEDFKDHRGNRIIIKNKNEKFSEKQKNKKVFVEDTSIIDNVEKIEPFICENRLNNVLSKMTDDEKVIQNFGKIMKLFVNDCITDIQEEYPDIEFSKNLKSYMSKKCAKLVKKYFNV